MLQKSFPGVVGY